MRELLGKIDIDKIFNHAFKNQLLNVYLCIVPLAKMGKSRWNIYSLSGGRYFQLCRGCSIQVLQKCCAWNIPLNSHELFCTLLFSGASLLGLVLSQKEMVLGFFFRISQHIPLFSFGFQILFVCPIFKNFSPLMICCFSALNSPRGEKSRLKCTCFEANQYFL